MFWRTSEQSITVIKTRQNKSTEQGFSGIIKGDEQRKCGESPGSTESKHWQHAGGMRGWSNVTPRLRTEEHMVIEQPLRSTDDGKDKMDLGGIFRIISVLSSLSFNFLTLIQDFS